MEQFAGFVSESEIKDFTAVQNQEYTEKFTYPAYELEFTHRSKRRYLQMENAVFPDRYQYLCLCLQSFSGFC